MVSLQVLACVVIPVIVLGLIVTRPTALMTLPSVVVDLAIGVVIILPIVAIQRWRSRKK